MTVVDVCIIRPGRHGVDNRWLMWAISSPQVREQIHSFQTGTTRRRISRKNLEKVQIAVPPLTEQHRIVEALEGHLSRLDAAEASISRGLKRSSHVWASVLNSVARGSLNGRTIRGNLSLVSEVAEVSGGIQKQQKRRPAQNPFPFLRVANVARGSLQLDEIHQIELFEGELERFRLERGDLLVVEGNGSPDQIGRAATWRGEIPDAVHQNHLIRVRPGERLLPRYLELVWNSPLVIDQLREVSRSTSGLHTLNTSKVKGIKIPVPPLAAQEVLVDDADAWEAYTQVAQVALQNAVTRSRLLRRSILRQAINGTLAAQDPNDEPASVLLDRIRTEREMSAKGKSVSARRPRKRAAVIAGASSLTPPGTTSLPSNATQQEFEL
ncbi:restriction endonuclease subunit S [Kitasatospora sp. NPDC090308]|uniref:restriction endonuclease subunit S n=1 Tax=Kitasatospora sp. NPDC090308 TaxID=3364082 RepID=UPI0038268FBA